MNSIAVVVSVYNQEKYIEECLESILSQVIDRPFTIYVSDDASTDSTPEKIAKVLAQNIDRLRVNFRKVNVGAARNYLDLHNAVTEDIVFHMDGDDLMLPGKMQRQIDVFQNSPDVNIVFHRAVYFDDSGRYFMSTGLPENINVNENGFHISLEDLALWGTVAVHSSYAYRKSSRGVRNLDREFMEWFYAMDSVVETGHAYFINDILIGYRSNLNGDSYLSTKTGRIKAYKIYLNDVLHYFEKKPKLKVNLYNNYLFSACVMIFRTAQVPKGVWKFLIANIRCFSIKSIYACYKARSGFSPKS